MQQAAILSEVRVVGRLNDSDDDYTAARISQDVTSTLQQVFGEKIVDAVAGAWLRKSITAVTADRARYRMPHRAQAMKLVQLSDETRIPYEIFGDVVEFACAPSVGTDVEFSYYLRPSLLCTEQTAGLITAKDTTALTVTFLTRPTNKVTNVTIASGDTFDVIHPNGWHELSLVGVVGTLSGAGPYTLTFPTGTDLTDVEVGDYVRSAEQTDWPCLPDEFHSALCVMTAARIHNRKGNLAKAKALAAEADADLERFATMIEPRVQGEPEVCVPSGGPIRGRRRALQAGQFGWR